MKEKSIKDEFDTECWCYRVVTDPYQVMAEVFSTNDMAHLGSFIKKILHYSEAEKLYCYGCEVIVHTKRSAFITKQFKEERHFTCGMLIIMPDESVIDEEMKTEIQEIAAHFGRLNMIIHPLGFVLKQMNERNLFFNWVRKNGMLLFERNATTQLMPEAGGEYKQQAEQFYSTHPQMENYLEERLLPVATAAPQKKNDPSIKPVEIRLTLDAETISSLRNA